MVSRMTGRPSDASASPSSPARVVLPELVTPSIATLVGWPGSWSFSRAAIWVMTSARAVICDSLLVLLAPRGRRGGEYGHIGQAADMFMTAGGTGEPVR